MSKKKEETKYATEEAFETLQEFEQVSENFLEKNAKVLGGVFGVLILAAVAYFAYLRFYQEPKNEEAAQEMAQADKMFEQDSMSAALKGSPGAYLGYEQIIEDFGSTPTGNIAKLKAGVAAYEAGEYQKALDYFKGFDAKESGSESAVQGAIGDCLVQLGDKEKAFDAFKKAIASSDLEVQQKIYTKKLAIVALDLQKYDEGLSILQKQIEEAKTQDPELEKLAERLTVAKGK